MDFVYTHIYYLTIPNNLTGHQFYPSDQFLKDHEEFIINCFGHFNLEYLKNKLIYLMAFKEDFNFFGKEELQIEALDKFRNRYSFGMWLVKDNCVYNGQIYMINKFKPVAKMQMNFNEVNNSSGEFQTTHFTQAELDLSRSYSDKLLSIMPDITESDKKHLKIRKPEYNYLRPQLFFNYNNFSRIGKCVSFIELARTTLSVIEKISWYVVALEALFSDPKDTSFIKKRISKLTSYFLSSDFSDVSLNTEIAYKMRSNYLHGSNIQKEYLERSEQAKISNFLDSYLRQILQMILQNVIPISIFNDQKEHSKYFKVILNS